VQLMQSPTAVNPLSGCCSLRLLISGDAQHVALMSSISMWPPGPIQSTEAETGKMSKMMARPTVTSKLNESGKPLKDRFIAERWIRFLASPSGRFSQLGYDGCMIPPHPRFSFEDAIIFKSTLYREKARITSRLLLESKIAIDVYGLG
jgi:hypothetical protein